MLARRPPCRRLRPRLVVGRLRTGSRRILLLVVLSLCLSAAGTQPARGARDLGPVLQTAEWQRLVNLWHALIDHSSDLVYSRPIFEGLVKDMDRADADLDALADRDLLPRSAADGLRDLLHARYRYIQRHHYTTYSHLEVDIAESARGAAKWIVEFQLAVLRRALQHPEESHEVVAAVESSLAHHVSFLHHLDKFEAEAGRRRADLKAKEDEGESVDWPAFDIDYYRRRNLLLDANREGRMPRVRSIQDLLPYLLALTESPPRQLSASADQPRSDL